MLLLMLSLLIDPPFIRAVPPAIPQFQVVTEQRQKGISFAAWWSGTYSTPGSDLALADLQATGADWISLIVTGYQADNAATTIDFTSVRTPTDADLVHVITLAHSRGLKVMLKPHLDLVVESPSDWRGNIGDYFSSEAQWLAWFNSYRTFILHYAQLAQVNGVEQFCVGTELLGTTRRRPSDWRNVISAVRGVFTGPLTYAALHSGEESTITFWDALDYIGVDAYYPLHDDPSHQPTEAELEEAWQAPIARLSSLSATWSKTIIITEVGYRSQRGCTVHPFDSTTTASICQFEQRDAYTALFNQLYNQPWLAGIYLWSWDPDRHVSGPCDDSYNPFDKPAAVVITNWYQGQVPIPSFTVPDYNKAQSIYGNSLASGWQNDSWGGTIALNTTDQVYAGATAIRATLSLSSWGAIAFTNANWDIDAGTWLQFYVRGDTSSSGKLQVILERADGTRLPVVPVNDCRHIAGASIEAGVWKRVQIPLSDFGLPGEQVSKLIIQYTGGAGDTATFWVDEISLIPARTLLLDYHQFIPLIVMN
ncbi:MAG: glycoside hydrolase family 113 [Anaerolineae bacterium]